MLIVRLREFTGRVPAVYANQTEFIITSLQSMSEHLIDLKRETLKEACEGFNRKLDRGTVTDAMIAEFKDRLDKLISGRDFRMVCASMVGSKELVRKRLSTLGPVSLFEEERKTSGRDTEADRRVREAYARLNFAPLVRQVNAAPDERTVDAALVKARAEVAEYCCLYHIPLNEDDTFTPFSLLCVDAVIAACYRILSNIRKARKVKSGGECLFTENKGES